MSECEHWGKNSGHPVIVEHEGVMKSFCSAGCVMESEMGGEAGLWNELAAKKELARRAIERGRSSKVITLIHRIELSNGTEQSIKMEDAEEILDEILSTPEDKPIDLVVHCPGGLVLAAEQIALALREHEGKVTAIVPFYAMSGATLVCLAADEILMEPFGVLGPLDPQISGFPSPSLLRLLELKGPRNVSDEMVILTDIAEKSIRQMRSSIKYILKGKLDDVRASAVAEHLTGGYLTHDSPLTAKELRSFGLRIGLDVPDQVHEFMRYHKLVSSTSNPTGTVDHPEADEPAGHSRALFGDWRSRNEPVDSALLAGPMRHNFVLTRTTTRPLMFVKKQGEVGRGCRAKPRVKWAEEARSSLPGGRATRTGWACRSEYSSESSGSSTER